MVNNAEILDVFIDKDLMDSWYIAVEDSLVSMKDGEVTNGSSILSLIESMTEEQWELPEMKILHLLSVLDSTLYTQYIGFVYNLIHGIEE